MIKRINLLKKNLLLSNRLSSLNYSTSDNSITYDVIVIGGGHAGCEAGLI